MPQLSQLALVYQSQWFWLLLVLGAIYFFVGRGIVPKVEATVDQRDAQIAADLAEAERLRTEASSVASAKAAAAKDAEKRISAADKRLAAKAEEAAQALDEARRSALAEVEGMAAEATREIVAKLTGTNVDEKAARTAVAGALSRA